MAALGLTLAAAACGHAARPELPESSIEKNAPPELRSDLARLYAKSPTARAKAASRLGARGPGARAALPYLASRLRDSSPIEGSVSANPFFETPDQVAFHAAAALLALGHDGEAVLLRALNDGDDNEKRAAIYTLGEAHVAAAVAPLTRMLVAHETTIVRENIPYALAKIGDHSALPALITAFERPENPRSVWAAAGAALADLEDVRAIDPALRMLTYPKDATRRHLAAQILSRIKRFPGVTGEQIERATAALTLASSEESEVSIEAIKALKELKR